jgi:hypothetical protein
VLALMVSNQKVLADAGGAQPRDSGVDPLGVGIDYDPYPPGILPNDLVPEIQRVTPGNRRPSKASAIGRYKHSAS